MHSSNRYSSSGRGCAYGTNSKTRGRVVGCLTVIQAEAASVWWHENKAVGSFLHLWSCPAPAGEGGQENWAELFSARCGRKKHLRFSPISRVLSSFIALYFSSPLLWCAFVCSSSCASPCVRDKRNSRLWGEEENSRWGGMKKKMERAVEGASRSCTHCLWAVTRPCRVLHGISDEALDLNGTDTTLPRLVLLHLMVYLPLTPSRSLIWWTVCQSFWSFPTDELKHPSELLLAHGF